MRSRVARLLLVSRCSALRGPTPDHLLWRLLTSAVSRNASLQDALRGLMGRCRFARSETGQHDLNARSFAVRHNLGRSCPSAPHRPGAQISPGKDANCRCTSAAFTVGRVPLGFAVMCQLASQPSALTMRFLSVASHICTRACLSDGSSQNRPCRRLVVKIALYESNSVLPQGTFTP
jgi:hypothetical protein